MLRPPRRQEVRTKRTPGTLLPARAPKAFDAWSNPRVPDTPWNMDAKLLLNPTVAGLIFWAIEGTPHYGRFIAVDMPGRIQHTWMSPNTSGLE